MSHWWYGRSNTFQWQNIIIKRRSIMKKTNMVKKSIVFIAVTAMAICPMADTFINDAGIPTPVSITASATQSRTGNFNKSYKLTGDDAKDIVAVAKKQSGKTGSNLGYSEEWCADFVMDCSRLVTGITTSEIPYAYSGGGSCNLLYSKMINSCNAKVVSTPKVGDLVFFDWSGKKSTSNLHHVAIVTAVSGNKVTVIGGNQGSGSSLYSRKVSTVTYSINYSCIAKYVRPNYGSASTPAKTDNTAYYKKYTGSSSSIATALKSLGIDSTFSFRAKIAVANGIVSSTSKYTGSSSQNKKMLSLLKSGKLKKVTSTSNTTTVKTYSYTIQSSSGAYVRSAAGTSKSVVGGLAKGSVVKYDRSVQANGYTWIHITSVSAKSGSWGKYTGYWVACV